jgi:hypothetical protein
MTTFGARNRTTFTGPAWLSAANRNDARLRLVRGPM